MRTKGGGKMVEVGEVGVEKEKAGEVGAELVGEKDVYVDGNGKLVCERCLERRRKWELLLQAMFNAGVRNENLMEFLKNKSIHSKCRVHSVIEWMRTVRRLDAEVKDFVEIRVTGSSRTQDKVIVIYPRDFEISEISTGCTLEYEPRAFVMEIIRLLPTRIISRIAEDLKRC